MADRPLEFVLAHLHLVADDLRRHPVVEGKEAAVGLHAVDDPVHIAVHLQRRFFADGQIQLAVRLDRCNARGDDVADAKVPDQFSLGDERGEHAVHCHERAEVAACLVDNAGHLVAGPVGALLAQVGIDVHCGAESLALIEVNSHQDLLPFLDALSGLLMERKQQVFVQSPVQEGADAAHLQDCQITDLMQHEFGLSARGDHSVLGILVEKDFQFIALADPLRHL